MSRFKNKRLMIIVGLTLVASGVLGYDLLFSGGGSEAPSRLYLPKGHIVPDRSACRSRRHDPRAPPGRPTPP